MVVWVAVVGRGRLVGETAHVVLQNTSGYLQYQIEHISKIQTGSASYRVFRPPIHSRRSIARRGPHTMMVLATLQSE